MIYSQFLMNRSEKEFMRQESFFFFKQKKTLNENVE